MSSAEGSFIVTVQEVVQSLESDTVTVCDPALRPVAVAVVSPLSHR